MIDFSVGGDAGEGIGKTSGQRIAFPVVGIRAAVKCPYGTRPGDAPSPSSELAGYYRLSLRD